MNRYSEKDIKYIFSCVKTYGVMRGCKIAAEVLGKSSCGVHNAYLRYSNPEYRKKQILNGKKHNVQGVKTLALKLKSEIVGEIYMNPTNLQQCFGKIAERTGYSKNTIELCWYNVLKKEVNVFRLGEHADWNVKNKIRR